MKYKRYATEDKIRVLRAVDRGEKSITDSHVEYWKWKSDPPNDADDLARVQAALPKP